MLYKTKFRTPVSSFLDGNIITVDDYHIKAQTAKLWRTGAKVHQPITTAPAATIKPLKSTVKAALDHVKSSCPRCNLVEPIGMELFINISRNFTTLLNHESINIGS